MIRIDDYLAKDISCDCGKTHHMDTKEVYIGEDAGNRLCAYVKERYVHIIVIDDVNTHETAGKKLLSCLDSEGIGYKPFTYPDQDLVPDEKAIGVLFNRCPKDCDLIIAVGTGTINDLCKYVSFKLGIDYIVFPSAPSMDGFTSSGAAMMIEGLKTTYPAHVPIALFADIDILSNAPLKMIVSGLCDIYGKYTCLLDWKIAHLVSGEYYCAKSADMVGEALREVVFLSDKKLSRDKEAIRSVMEALVLTGISMSFTGNSRPASGCEHHLSHYWEMRYIMEGRKPILHGLKVGLGLITCLKMYSDLLDEDISFETAKARPFDKEDWTRKMEERFKEAAPGVIRLEEESRKNDVHLRNERLSIIEERWEEIRELIKELPDYKDIQKLFLLLSAPVDPRQIGLSLDLVEEGIEVAKEVRDRYTLLQLLSDLGLSAEYAKRMRDFYAYHNDVYKTHLETVCRENMERVKLFVLDMDGTIYLGNELFPYTKSFLEKVKESGKDYCYFTNNSSRNRQDYLDKLERMGIGVSEDKMISSVEVIIEYLKEKAPEDTYFIVGTNNLVKAFEKAGLKINDEDPDTVILGFDTSLDYEKLNKACRFLRHGANYYGVNMDYNCPVEGGEYIPDCGSIAKLIERSTGRFPEFFGKPSRHTLEYILKHTGYKEEELCFVGDRIYTDIRIANGTKALSILVLSGETQLKDLEGLDYGPDIILDTLEDINKYL